MLFDTTPKTIEIGNDNKIYTMEFIKYTYSSLLISKIDGISNEPLANAEFLVTSADGTVVGNSNGKYTTNSSGEILIPNLVAGTYKITETKAPDYYQIDDTPQTIVIDNTDEIYTVTFENYPYSSLLINKTDGITGEPLMLAEFLVTDSDGIVVGDNGIYATNENGEIFISNLKADTYKVTEVTAPTGYVLDTTAKTIKIENNNDIHTLDFVNYPLSNLTIKKVDGDTNEPLKGAEFKITTSNGSIVNINDNQGIFTTDENGSILIETLEPDTYTITETKAPTGYVLNTDAQNVKIDDDDKKYEVTFKNYKSSNLTIKKVDGDTNEPLQGAEFKITRLDGSVLNINDNNGIFTTNEYGVILLENLEDNTYTITETKAPSGYSIDTTSQTIEINTNNVKYEMTFKNYKKGGLIIKKFDEDSKKALQGVEFEITTMTGERLEDENNRTTFTTDKNGEIVFTDLADGYYNVKEIKALDGYILDTEVKNVKVEGTETTILEVPNKQQSSLLIIKTDAKTGLPLEGVIFDVRKVDGTFVSGNTADLNQPNTENNSPNTTTSNNGNLSGSYTTDANGRILINNIDIGQYNITETKALDGYELDTNVHQVTVLQGKQATLSVTNTPLSGIKLTKIDSITKQSIYNVKFMVFDMNNKVIGTFYTDNNGVIDFLSILTEGRYTIRETRPADGYFADDVPRTVEFVSGKTTEITWENTPIAGQIQITKLSSNDNEMNGLPAGTPLDDAIFEVYDWKTGNVVDRFITGNNGVGVSNPLPLGRYTVKEIQAPAYYVLNNE